MTESAKIAKLWSNFHRLSEGYKEVVLETAEMMAWREKSPVGKKTADATVLKKKPRHRAN